MVTAGEMAVCSAAVDLHAGLVAGAGEYTAMVRSVCAMCEGKLDDGLPLLGSSSSDRVVFQVTAPVPRLRASLLPS